MPKPKPWQKTRLTTDGRTGHVSRGSVQMLAALRIALGYARGTLTVFQFGWRPSSSYSGSTHAGDMWDLSANDWKTKVWVLRLLGAMVFFRTVADGAGSWDVPHAHGYPLGSTTVAPAGAGQGDAYKRGRNGLRNNGPDRDRRPRYAGRIRFVPDAPIQRWEAVRNTAAYSQPGGHRGDLVKRIPKGFRWKTKNIATVEVEGLGRFLVSKGLRFYPARDFRKARPVSIKPKPRAPIALRAATYNLPGEDKLPNPLARIEEAVELIQAARLDVVGLQELVGPGRDKAKKGSKFATQLDTAMGSGWTLVVPTTALNENYALIRDAAVKLVKQHPDLKVYATVTEKGKVRNVPGRHLTVMVLKDVEVGRSFVFGVSHLVNDDPAGAQAQSKIIAAELRRVSKAHGGLPIVVCLDANTGDDLTGFTEAGLRNARRIAEKTATRDTATFTSYGKVMPDPKADRLLDAVYVSQSWDVAGYRVERGLESDGTFPRTRPSDHMPVIIAATTKE